jgi:hypothetical protein
MLAIQDSTVLHNFYTAMQGNTTASPAQQLDDNPQTAGMSDESRLQMAQNFSRNIGLVHISSGMTDILCSRRLDWALVGLTASRFAGGIENLSNVSGGARHDYHVGSSSRVVLTRKHIIETARTPTRIPFGPEV